ncbi:MAG TPA: hypothetical protein VM054_07580 [bacterium]|nr:hypothetical protein [bacterium]
MFSKMMTVAVLTLSFLVGCEEEPAVEETGDGDTTRFDPAVEREIMAAADGFFAELTMLHEPEAKAYVDFTQIGDREWEEYWDRLKSYGLEVASVTLLRVEPPIGDDPDTARIGVDAELLVDGEEVSVEAYRLPLVRTPDGWRLTELPFAE